MIKIIVDSQELKDKILSELKLIYDYLLWRYGHSDKANTLMHVYMNPDLIEVKPKEDEK